MRRLVHLVLLIALVAAIRACGGLTVVGDRLTSTTRALGERTGVKTAQQKWKTGVEPQITGAARNAAKKGHQAVSDALDRAASDLGKD